MQVQPKGKTYPHRSHDLDRTMATVRLQWRQNRNEYGSRLAPLNAYISATYLQWACSDSNREPRDYESPALTVELQARRTDPAVFGFGVRALYDRCLGDRSRFSRVKFTEITPRVPPHPRDTIPPCPNALATSCRDAPP